MNQSRTLFAASLLTLVTAGSAYANHPVLVEGNCPGPASRTTVTPGTCGDYDGDGRIGTAEDNDGPDRIFGTINAALGAGAGTGANQNGKVIIVRDGVFPETITITGANGNVILEAAPGVEADIDAVLQGDPGSAARQDAPGIIIDAPADRFVIIRNVEIRNWRTGILVRGNSRAEITTCRLDSNVDYGIQVRDRAKVKIYKSEVVATGRRVGGPTPNSPVNDFPRVARPEPGNGIDFSGDSSGLVAVNNVSHSVGAGVASRSNGKVCVDHLSAFGNNPDTQNVSDCASDGDRRW